MNTSLLTSSRNTLERFELMVLEAPLEADLTALPMRAPWGPLKADRPIPTWVTDSSAGLVMKVSFRPSMKDKNEASGMP